MMLRLKDVAYVFIEKILRWCIHPQLRGKILKVLGAEIGERVRVNEVFFVNLWNSFRNLSIYDYAFIGQGCLIDLTGRVEIGARTSISPRCTLLTHEDPGSMLGNKIISIYPKQVKNLKIGSDTWIGAGSIILCGVTIGSKVIIGAGSMVNKDIPDNTLAFGNPVKIVKSILNE